MTKKSSKPHFLSNTQRFILTGILTLVPLWVTWIIFEFVLRQLSDFGKPATLFLADLVGAEAQWVTTGWFEAIVSILLTLLLVYAVGWATSRFVGRRLIHFFDTAIQTIPIVERVYGSVKKLMSVLQTKPDGVQRVVLIEFPSRQMKTVGFVTRTLIDEDTGETIAAVYVPTTPNPTSGYLELVPMHRLVSTDWTVEEAMTFIISGGAISRETINYSKSKGAPIELDQASTPDAQDDQENT
ncbi:MAG: DUF502 domain-containing protein [Alphaproteobacteria bacterium]|nr:MAG: DUF502 domain-containing protein [Alphaproteobacteria bacterium]